MIKWLNLELIEHDRALQMFAACLALTLPLTLAFWGSGIFGDSLSQNIRPFCWPGLELSCLHHPVRYFSPAARIVFWGILLFFAFSASIKFYYGQVRSGFLFLIIAFALKAFWQSVDYTTMGNYHYMPYAALIFLMLLKSKRLGLLFLIVSFYWFAGALKLDSEWLNGFALGVQPPWLPKPLFDFSLHYVVFLELVISICLLAKTLWLRTSALVQFLLFHAFSWLYVGFFYPLTMLLLLSLFVWDLKYKASPVALAKRDMVLLALFCMLQLIPRLVGKDPALFTTLRLPALNMFDARSVCESGFYLHFRNETRELIPDYQSMNVRLHCDPILLRSDAQSLCRELQHDVDFKNIDLFLLSRRTRDDHYQTVLLQKNVCKERAQL